ncbi:polysaccharide biosynthesis/export family protein [Flexibacterium corallicola]|uniref:polysaccharide biosynthesis/export family protein n=1 Tax=Flexibacterium corallicola TaxID=3037259 RepID=UPI00286F7C34|nr:polysaccharide biosynthesis/export family protein [Pseudovibrio sp. M1P-2-3]
MRWIWVLFIWVSIIGCTKLPSGGPSAYAISSTQVQEDAYTAKISVVDLDHEVISILNNYRPQIFSDKFSAVQSGSHGTVLGVGDVLSVLIWEAAPDGLFSTLSSKQSKVDVVVNANGNIFIPYAGRLRAKGLTLEQIRQAIQHQLLGKAIEPQVIVHLTDNRSNSVVVVGDVKSPGRYSLPIGGAKLLEVVADAGGAREASYETVITLKRGNRSGTARFEDLIENPRNNINVASGDNILLSYHPRSFSAFGAVGEQKLVPFKTQSLSLSEALALVGGIEDTRADPKGVFIFRYEERQLVGRLAPKALERNPNRMLPVVYRLNVLHADGYLRAQAVEMEDKDILYVANHPTAELGKFLQILSPLISSYAAVYRLEVL